MKKALLLGSYGQTNIGDDILMFNYLSLLNELGYENIYVNVNRKEYVPEAIKKQFPNLVYLETYNTSIFKWLKVITSSNLIMYGGGTIYKELYKTTGRNAYAVIVRIMVFNIIAKIFAVPLINMNIGIGTIKTKIGRFITKIALLASSYTIFRDEDSYNYASKVLNIPINKMLNSTDGIFLNDIWIGNLSKTGSSRVAGINILHDIPEWVDEDDVLDVYAGFINKLIENNYKVILIPFQCDFNPHNDLVYIKNKLFPKLKKSSNINILGNTPLLELPNVFKSLDIFIGMRLHSLILSMLNSVPFIGIEYDTKCARFIKSIEYPYSIPIEKLDIKRLNETFTKILENREKVVTHLKIQQTQQVALIKNGVDYVLRFR